MVKSFKFLLQLTWVNLASILGFAAAVTVGAVATGVPGGYNLFNTYFGSFPFIALMMVFMFAIGLCTVNLNVALSFGARRRDYFWAIQGIMLLYVGVCWVIQAVMSSIPLVFHWTEVDYWSALMTLGTGSSWLYPLTLLSIMSLGCLCGLAMSRSRTWGVVLFVAALLAFLVAMILLMLGSRHSGTWGDLPMILFLVTLVILAVSEFFIWRTVQRFVVR